MIEWVWVNLLIPVVIPITCLAFFKLVKPEISIKKTIRDGQLGWVAVCFAASSKYELGLLKPAPEWKVMADWIAIIFILLTSILTVAATIHPFDDEKEQYKSWYKKYRVMLATGCATVTCGIMYGLVHYMQV